MSGAWNNKHTKYVYAYNCGDYMRYGKTLCFSHFIVADTLEKIVLDEKAIREEFIRHNAEMQENSIKAAKKELQGKANARKNYPA